MSATRSSRAIQRLWGKVYQEVKGGRNDILPEDIIRDDGVDFAQFDGEHNVSALAEFFNMLTRGIEKSPTGVLKSFELLEYLAGIFGFDPPAGIEGMSIPQKSKAWVALLLKGE